MRPAHTAQQPKSRRWNRPSTPTSTSTPKDPQVNKQVLWTKSLLRLEEEQLDLEDLPISEELFWGMLQELSFTS